MILIPPRARSAGDEIPAGLSAGTTMVRMFPANATAAPSARPLSVSFFGFDVSAERNTSAGAPCPICVSSAADESVEIVRIDRGCDASHAGLILSRAPLREAAPYTVSGAGSIDPVVPDGERR